MERRLWIIPFAAAAFVAPAQSKASSGYYLDGQSAKAAGRAYSGEVVDQGAEALWWNPAGIAGQERPELQLNAAVILPSSELVDRHTMIVRPFQAPAPVGGGPVARGGLRRGVLPTAGLAWPVTPRFALGLAITSPYSFTTDYASDSWVRYTADRTYLRTIDVQPSIAYAPAEWLRVGAGLNVEHVDATLSNKLPNLSASAEDGNQRLTGKGIDVGYNIGVQLHNDIVTAGLAYRSSVNHHLKGDIAIDGLTGLLAGANGRIDDLKATFRTPWQLTAGLRVNASRRLTLNVQTVRMGWGKFDRIQLSGPLAAAIPENYRNSWSVAVGGDYRLSDTVTLRAGAQHDETPTQNTQRDARVPDSNRWNYAVGASIRLKPRLTLDAAVNYVRFAGSSIDRLTAAYVGTPAQTPIIVDGYSRNTGVLVLAVGARIGF